jgi:hypothetical protein
VDLPLALAGRLALILQVFLACSPYVISICSYRFDSNMAIACPLVFPYHGTQDKINRIGRQEFL